MSAPTLESALARAAELEERLEELRTAVAESTSKFDAGEAPDRIFRDLRRQLERVPAGRWDRDSCIAAGHEWNAAFGEPPKAVDWNPAQARALGREDCLERWASGDWPGQRTITRVFGRWNAFLVACGFEERHGPEDLTNAGGRVDYEGFPVWTGWRMIPTFRENVGVTQVELARRIGTSHPYIGLIERGVKTNPTIRTVIALGLALGIGPRALLEYELPEDLRDELPRQAVDAALARESS